MSSKRVLQDVQAGGVGAFRNYLLQAVRTHIRGQRILDGSTTPWPAGGSEDYSSFGSDYSAAHAHSVPTAMVLMKPYMGSLTVVSEGA